MSTDWQAVAEHSRLRYRQVRMERDALERFIRDFIDWCDDGQRTMQQLDRLQDQARDLVWPL